jgi:hypothetical protein
MASTAQYSAERPSLDEIIKKAKQEKTVDEQLAIAVWTAVYDQLPQAYSAGKKEDCARKDLEKSISKAGFGDNDAEWLAKPIIWFAREYGIITNRQGPVHFNSEKHESCREQLGRQFEEYKDWYVGVLNGAICTQNL